MLSQTWSRLTAKKIFENFYSPEKKSECEERKA